MNTRYFNSTFDGSDIPVSVGDRYYGQDRIRDMYHHKEYGATIARGIVNRSGNTIINGGLVSQGAGFSINVTQGYGIVTFQIKVPTDFSTLPPPISTEDIPIIVEIPALTNQGLTGTTNDGVTINYVKIAYNETFVSSRARAKATGSYDSETESNYTLTANATPPTTYELTLAQFTTDGTTLNFVGEEARGVSVTAISENIGSLYVDGSGDIILDESILFGQTIPQQNLGAISGLTASAWYFVVVREDTQDVSLQALSTLTPSTFPASWSPNLANNQLDMLPFFDKEKNYCWYDISSVNYRIAALFETNATPDGFEDSLVRLFKNEIFSDILLTNSVSQTISNSTEVFVTLADIKIDLLSEISGTSTSRVYTAKKTNTITYSYDFPMRINNTGAQITLYYDSNIYKRKQYSLDYANHTGDDWDYSLDLVLGVEKTKTLELKVQRTVAQNTLVINDFDTEKGTCLYIKGRRD